MENFVKQCMVCQQAKHDHTHPAGLLQPLPIPEGAWQDISLDFIEGLPMSHNSNVILVIVDRFTKYAHFLPLKHPFTASQVAKLLLDSMIKLHGVPKTMVFLTMIEYFLVLFGKISSLSWGLNYYTAQPTIHRHMGRPRGSTNSSKCISGAPFRTLLHNGPNGFL